MKSNPTKWTLIAAVNSESVLQNTLLRSPDIDLNCQLLTKRNFASAATAYNHGLAEATSEIVVLAHQDVYFPAGWKDNLNRIIEWLSTRDPTWGVLGVFGVTSDVEARAFGHCYSTGLRRVLGNSFDEPYRAQALDEMVLIVRRSSGLRFDEDLSGFHLYGIDLCLQAYQVKMNCYIIPAFCVHNSNGLRYLPWSYWRSYFYMRRKWWDALPFTTCCSVISRSLRPAVSQVVSDLRQWMLGGKNVGSRCDDIATTYRKLVAEGVVSCAGEFTAEEYVLRER